jgi:hypothetical protein
MAEEVPVSCVNVQDLQAVLTEKLDSARLAVFEAVAEANHLSDVAFNLEAQGGLLRVSSVHANVELQELFGLLEASKARAKEVFNTGAFLQGQ